MLPNLPFPSRECEIAKLTKSGSINSSFIYLNKLSNNNGTSLGIGGIKIASSIPQPLGPIQF